MISIIQIFALVFALFAWSRALMRFKDKRISLAEFGFWTVIWVGVLIVAFVPGVAGGMAEFVGIQRPVDLAIYVALVLVFYLVFRIYVKHEQLEQDLTKLVREVAIKRAKKK